MRELCVMVFWTSWALRLTSLPSSFLLASLNWACDAYNRIATVAIFFGNRCAS